MKMALCFCWYSIPSKLPHFSHEENATQILASSLQICQGYQKGKIQEIITTKGA
jgi:hypothetical protein